MPVLMVALLALGAFAAIGILLATAVILESHGKHEHPSPIPGARLK
jgi:hypothetical protein